MVVIFAIMNQRKFDLEDRLIEFADRAISTAERLPETRKCSHLGGQLIRSGTSTALNYGEAQAAESKRDFIHKFTVILKELRETSICLKILQKGSLLIDIPLLAENGELIAIFVKSIATARMNSKDFRQ